MTRAPKTSCPELPSRCRLHFLPRRPAMPRMGLVTPPSLLCIPMPRMPSTPLSDSNPWIPPAAGQSGFEAMHEALCTRAKGTAVVVAPAELHDGGGDHPFEPVAARVGDVGGLIGHGHPGSRIHRAGEDVKARRPGIDDDGDGPPSSDSDLHRGGRASWLTLATQYRDWNGDPRNGPSGRSSCPRGWECCQTQAEEGRAHDGHSAPPGFSSSPTLARRFRLNSHDVSKSRGTWCHSNVMRR